MTQTIISEGKARSMAVCVGCDRPKEPALIVCWECFKHNCPKASRPLKYSGLSFEAWQEGFSDWKVQS